MPEGRPARCGSVRSFTDIGGLLSYAPGIAEGCCSAGIVIGKILKGDKSAELPVEQVANIEFIINLKTARRLVLLSRHPPVRSGNEVIE